ncbi:hypothetical protein [Alistipes finegoldii]|uniref:hypothetical protein n=1 Tax=Alistipes finegoldii TaxID=214856 RepID=UPI001EE0FFE0|nr:hypothetical protein [Alistipes finegoldii]MCG4955322.1 hypothetical protein [Alistipes finegoldii]
MLQKENFQQEILQIQKNKYKFTPEKDKKNKQKQIMTNFTAQTFSPAHRKNGRSVFRAAYPADRVFRCNPGSFSEAHAAKTSDNPFSMRRPYTYILYNKRKSPRISIGLGISA